MPNTENIRKWVDALRSGEYEQGIGALNENGKFCCLGVACEVAIKDGLAVVVTNQQGLTDYDGEAGVLPLEVVKWLGVDSSDPQLNGLTAVQMNDGALDDPSYSFIEIADAIERKYLS